MERCSKHQGKGKEDVMRRVGEGAEQKTLEEEIMSIRKNKKERAEGKKKKPTLKYYFISTQNFNRIKRKQGENFPLSFQTFHAKF